MTKEKALEQMKGFESKLPYGAKAKIAAQLTGKGKGNRHNVQTAFRGMAGEKLTIRVLQKAKKLFPEQTKISRKRKSNTKSSSK